MIVVMRSGAPRAQIDAVLRRIAADRQPVHVFHGEERVVIAILGESPSEELRETLETMPGVEEVGRTTRPYKLASREVRPSGSLVRVGSATYGEGFVLGAGADASTRRRTWSGWSTRPRGPAPTCSGSAARQPRTWA